MDVIELKRRCLEAIDNHRDEICRLGEDVYKTPELGFREFRTTKRMEEAFEEFGLPVATGIDYTGCRISTENGDGPRVAVMGELDCVACAEHPDSTADGNVHACGHHAQLANLYGCAIGLLKSGILSELGGNVDFTAIPAEECIDYDYRDRLIREGEIAFYGGKPEYLRRGGLDNVDMILQCHMMEMPKEGQRCTVDTHCNGFATKGVRFLGRAAHAGIAPFDGINALNMAELAMNNIHALRETFREEDKVRVSCIITDGGGIVNVVPSEVTMQIMVRAYSAEAILEAGKKVDRALKAAALALGGKVEISSKMGYLPLQTDRLLSSLYRENMITYAQADENSFLEVYETAGSTDLGDLSHIMPCMHVWTEGIHGGLHTKDYRIADPELAYIQPAKMLALTVIDLLSHEAEKAKHIMEKFHPSFTKAEYLEFMKNHSKVELFDSSTI